VLGKIAQRDGEKSSSSSLKCVQTWRGCAGCVSDAQNPELCDFRENQAGFPYHREASYFEIPTTDFHPHPKPPEAELHEVPTKDTDTPLATHLAPVQVQAQAQAPPSPPTPTPPVGQSHASLTIEFDDFTPGKIKIKDHVTKFTSRQRKQQQQSSHLKAPVGTAADVMSAQSKVADWLVHSDVSCMMMKKRPTCEDTYSTKSDLAVNIKTLKGQRPTCIIQESVIQDSLMVMLFDSQL